MNKNPLDAMERFVALLDAPEPSFARIAERRKRRRRRRQIATGAGGTAALAGFAAAMVWVLPIGSDRSPDATQIAVATESDVATAPATTEPAVVEWAQAPVEFTACHEGAHVSRAAGGTEETLTIPVEGGEMTIDRGRGWIVPQIVTEVSDPRLDGDWSWGWNEDDYTSGPGPEANIVTIVWRVENDEGAWQGSQTFARFGEAWPDTQVVLTGEGAYEGLSAVMAVLEGEDCPNRRGYIVSIGVPEAEGTFPAS